VVEHLPSKHECKSQYCQKKKVMGEMKISEEQKIEGILLPVDPLKKEK
jgi:hypothetical protein